MYQARKCYTGVASVEETNAAKGTNLRGLAVSRAVRALKVITHFGFASRTPMATHQLPRDNKLGNFPTPLYAV